MEEIKMERKSVRKKSEKHWKSIKPALNGNEKPLRNLNDRSHEIGAASIQYIHLIGLAIKNDSIPKLSLGCRLARV